MIYKAKIPQIMQGRYEIFPASEIQLEDGQIACPSCQGHGKEQRCFHSGQITEKDYDACCSCGGCGIVSAPGKPHTCPLRGSTGGPWDSNGKDVDRYTFSGNDLVCSFCGSIDFEGFKDMIALCLKDENVLLEVNDHRDKIYFQRPWVRNATTGAIKFKTAHLPENWKETIGKDLNEALRLSHERFNKKLSALKP